MHISPLLMLHISGGIMGFLSGAVAMTFRKGSRGHRMSGNVFFVSMLCMSAAGAFLAFMKFQFVNVEEQIVNVFGGSLTFYLAATAWAAARRKDGETGIFDWGCAPGCLGGRSRHGDLRFRSGI